MLHIEQFVRAPSRGSSRWWRATAVAMAVLICAARSFRAPSSRIPRSWRVAASVPPISMEWPLALDGALDIVSASVSASLLAPEEGMELACRCCC